MHLRTVALGFVAMWFLIGGTGHFVVTDFFVSIVPAYVPYPREMVWISGVFELLGAVGIVLPATRRLAGLGLVLLTLAVTPANVHMWLHPDQFPMFPSWTYGLRLVVQGILLACIWWATQPVDARMSKSLS